MTPTRVFGSPSRAARHLAGAGLLAALVVLALNSCGVPLVPSLPESGVQYASRAVASWRSEDAHRFKGTFSVSSSSVQVDVVLTSTDAGEGLGAGAADNASFQFLEQSQKLYLKGQAFWQAYYNGQATQQKLAKGFQENWTVAGDNNIALGIAQLPDLGGLIAKLDNDQHHVKRGGTRRIAGHLATAVKDGSTTYWVTSGQPGLLVGVQAASAGGLQNLDLTMTTASAPSGLQSQLGTPVDPSDPSTLPAYYHYEGQTEADPDNCNQNGCAIQVTIYNQGGTPAGPAAITVNAYSDQALTQLITSCSVGIPATIATGQTGTAQCTLAGAAWSAFSGTTFYVNGVVTQNPPYV